MVKGGGEVVGGSWLKSQQVPKREKKIAYRRTSLVK